MKLLFVTKNAKKIKAAKNSLEKNGIIIEPISFDLKEIQEKPREVAIQKARDAYSHLKQPLMINDSSFSISALNEFPSSYASYVEKTLGSDGILKLLEGKKNREAFYLDILVYIDAYGYQVFEDKTEGFIALKSFEGDFYPYDKIFIKKGDQYPIAFYGKEAIDKIYENKTYLDLANFLEKRKVSRGITFIENKVLLLHRIRKEKGKYLEYYAIPGGGVEASETYEEACIREVKEETSVSVSIHSYLGFEEYQTGVCYYFLTNYQEGEPTLGGEEKERNCKENFYEVKLIDMKEIDSISFYGMGLEMIKKAYQLNKEK